MTTRRPATRTDEEENVNVGVPPQDNQAPPQEQAHLGNQVPLHSKKILYDQALVNPPAMTDGDIRTSFINFAQTMTTKFNL